VLTYLHKFINQNLIMKKILLFILIFINLSAFSQEWLKKLPQDKLDSKTLTMFDIQKAFNDYWEPFNVENGKYLVNGKQSKAIGWKQFRRWEYFWNNRVNPETGEFPKTQTWYEYEKYLEQNPKLSLYGNWTNLGLNSSNGGYYGVGRVNCVAFHPTNPNIFWIGSPAGGIWVTTEGGNSWTPLGDKNLVIGVSDIAIPADYETSHTIYIATGDRDGGSLWSLGGSANDNNSIGVLKSTDNGLTWNKTGLSFEVKDVQLVTRLLINPNNPQILFASTTKGIFKTTDGGENWNLVKGGNFMDIEFKPNDENNTLYAATIGNPNIYKSIDGGENWTLKTNFSNFENRINIATSIANPAVVYAIVSAEGGGFSKIIKSIDSGETFEATFSQVANGMNLLGWSPYGDDSGGQGDYTLSIGVSPIDENVLFVGGVNTWISTNGGFDFQISNHWYGGGGVQDVHADKHFMCFNDAGIFYEANDGGIYKSSDNGNNWTDLSNGMAISQIYRFSNSTIDNETIMGLQDNGTKLKTDTEILDVIGGDGMECIIDYTNSSIQYGSMYYGEIERTTNHWGSSTTISYNIPDEQGYWVTPFIIDPLNHQTLYVGYDNVWKTTNSGNSFTKLNMSIGSARNMAICETNTNCIYVANQSNILMTTDGGLTSNSISFGIYGGAITYIAVKYNDPNTIWATVGSYSGQSVWETKDAGQTWTNISAGLPNVPAMTIVQNKLNTSENELYIGTDVGVFVRLGNGTWENFNADLPNVVVTELEIKYGTSISDSKLRAATFGRGLWESDLYNINSSMLYISSTSTQNDISEITKNDNDKVILGFEIKTTGNQNPIGLQQITINTNGSTNAINDIENIKIYFTENSNIFNTNTLLATILPSENNIDIPVSKDLLWGTNYFWLVYDISQNANFGDTVDAEIVSLKLSSNTDVYPQIQNPGNGRVINHLYCESTSLNMNTFYEYIKNVKIGNIDNSTENNGYSYYQTPIEMVLGNQYPITINTKSINKGKCLIYIDWNFDGDFDDLAEFVYESDSTKNIYNTSINPPAFAVAGLSRMRIKLINYQSNPESLPCGEISKGEIEDYLLKIYDNQNSVIAISKSELNFGKTTINTFSTDKSFILSGKNLDNNISIQSPLDFNISTESNNNFGSNLSINQADYEVGKQIFVKYNPSTLGFVSKDLTFSNISTNLILKLNGEGIAVVSLENQDNNLINIYPNPSNGIFYLDYKNLNSEKLEISIVDLTGKIIYSKYIENNNLEIDLTNFSKGLYIISFKTDSKIYRQKIVLE